MKKSVKALLLTLCAVVLVVATVFTTLAYMTSTSQKVTNTFTVGNISITLDESKLNADGTLDVNTRVQGNEYKLVAGKAYAKDPTITVGTGSEDSYLYVRLENGIADLMSGDGNPGLNITKFKKVTDDGLYVYVGEGEDPVMVNDQTGAIKVFEGFTIDSDETAATLASAASAKIKLQAFAIQADAIDEDIAQAQAYATLFTNNTSWEA